MEVLSVDNKIMTVNGKLAKAPSTTGTGDMKKSVYDPTGIVEAAGGIPDYVANNTPVTSVNGKTGEVELVKADVGLSQVANVLHFSHCTRVPIMLISAFDNIPSDCEIRVPSSLVDQWKADSDWTGLADHIVGV